MATNIIWVCFIETLTKQNIVGMINACGAYFMAQKLSLSQKQSLNLTLSLRHSLSILQMSQMELFESNKR
ncbi:MAG UNVERIFIED_CONTAM: hypothetical protein LVQ98_06940 [Rickettsiaceae bacterium]|jgi:hypothetical protein